MIGIFYHDGLASTTCGNCRLGKTVSLKEIAAADGVFVCPHCREPEPLSAERCRRIALILARIGKGQEREKGNDD